MPPPGECGMCFLTNYCEYPQYKIQASDAKIWQITDTGTAAVLLILTPSENEK